MPRVKKTVENEEDSIEKPTVTELSPEPEPVKERVEYTNGRRKPRTEAQKNATKKMLEAKAKKAEERAEKRALELLAKKNGYEKAPEKPTVTELSPAPEKAIEPTVTELSPPKSKPKKVKKPPKVVYETESESSSSEEEYTVVRKRKPRKTKPIDIPPPRDLTSTSQGDTAVPLALPFRFV